MKTDFPVEGNYSFKLNIDGYPLMVTYKRTAFGDYYENQDSESPPNLVHFEFRGITASETGYKSHYTYTEAIESTGGGPFEFAKLCAQNLYEGVKAMEPERFSKQLKLF